MHEVGIGVVPPSGLWSITSNACRFKIYLANEQIETKNRMRFLILSYILQGSLESLRNRKIAMPKLSAWAPFPTEDPAVMTAFVVLPVQPAASPMSPSMPIKWVALSSRKRKLQSESIVA